MTKDEAMDMFLMILEKHCIATKQDKLAMEICITRLERPLFSNQGINKGPIDWPENFVTRFPRGLCGK